MLSNKIRLGSTAASTRFFSSEKEGIPLASASIDAFNHLYCKVLEPYK